MIDYKALFNNAPNPYLILDSSLNIVEVNQAYLNATMTKRDMLLGRYLFDVFPANPEELEANGVSNLQASMNDVLKYRKADTMAVQKYDIPKRDGGGGFEERFWCSVNSPVLGDGGEVVLIIHNAQDVTDFIQTKPESNETHESLKVHVNHLENKIYQSAQSLQEANRKLRIANEAKSTFLTSMSHELRTPLNSILGFTQILIRDVSIGKEQKEELGIIYRSGKHLLNLINDVLDLTKIETGKMTLHEKTFDLYSFLREVSELFHSRTVEKGLLFTMEKDEKVPRYIKSDEGKLRQVLINLLGNALKFTESGRISLRVKLGNVTENSHELRFEVEDTGIGISSDYLEKIFEPFVQVSESVDKTAGTGLGLSISKKYIRLMGGNIEVVSKIGKGSLFQFEVLVGRAEASEIEVSQHSRKVVGIVPDQPTFRILVVDDVLESKKLLVKLLKNVGFEVNEASNGKQGVEVFESWHPHLIWMDMRMPVMDGYEATKQIKKTELGQKTVIIALTAHAFEEERQEILNTGCNDFVSKPYVEEEIFMIMEKHLGIQFVYEDQDLSLLNVPKNLEAILTPDNLTKIEKELKDELLNTVTTLDQEGCLKIIERIHVANPGVASALRMLVDNYQFEELDDILNKKSSLEK
ncbi:MAG: response regulator [Leptospiraceae bacterium]|nr:response regulator [Leptospiraceae bacterium]MCP5494784.1 response regulator [Leptospiraceae bacterium]